VSYLLRRNIREKEIMNKEEFRVNGEELVGKIKALVKEGNIRKIAIKNSEGKQLLEIPLTFGVVGVLLAPVLAAIGALAALVTKCTIVVYKEEDGDPPARQE